MPPTFNHGDKVLITKGIYKSNGHGTFLRLAGAKKACVKVDNDTRQERSINLDSIQRAPLPNADPPNYTAETVTINRQRYEELLSNLEQLRTDLTELEEAVKSWVD